MRLLIIDLANTSEIKILNTNIKKSIQIISAYYMTISEDKDPILAIAEKIRAEKLSNIPAIIIPPRSIMNYHTFNFPLIPVKEIRKILPREIQNHEDSTEEIVFDFSTGPTIIEKNEKKVEVIVYFIKKNDIWEILEQFKANGILAIKIIPEVQSIETYVKESFITESNTPNGVVIIEMMDNKINLNILNKSAWSLNREFPFKLASGTSIEDRDFSRISTEFSRTFQYFKQKNKNVSIDEAIIYGSNQDIGILNDFINENQPLNSNLISNIMSDEKIILPQKLKDKDEFISMFFVGLTTANSILRKDYIDLYPKEFTEKENFPKQILIYSLIGIALFITLAVTSGFFQKQKNNYRNDLKKVETEFNQLQTQIDQILEVRKKRKDYYEKIILMENPKKVSFQTADFLRELTLTFTDDLPSDISKLSIIYKDGKLKFSLNGKLRSDSINGALTSFDILLKRVKGIKRLKISNFTPPSSATVAKEKNYLSWVFNIIGDRDLEMEQ